MRELAPKWVIQRISTVLSGNLKSVFKLASAWTLTRPIAHGDMAVEMMDEFLESLTVSRADKEPFGGRALKLGNYP